VGSGSAPGGLRVGSCQVGLDLAQGTAAQNGGDFILISETYKNKARDGTISDLQRLYSLQVSQNWRTNYVLTTLSRMFKFTFKKYGKKIPDKKTKKKQLFN
jgi:hypothetical protein